MTPNKSIKMYHSIKLSLESFKNIRKFRKISCSFNEVNVKLFDAALYVCVLESCYVMSYADKYFRNETFFALSRGFVTYFLLRYC